VGALNRYAHVSAPGVDTKTPRRIGPAGRRVGPVGERYITLPTPDGHRAAPALVKEK